AFSFRLMLISQLEISFDWVPPDAGPARPIRARHAASGCALVAAATGSAAATADGQPRPFTSTSTNSASALPFRVSSDTQQPVYARACTVAGRPCQSISVSDPGCAGPEFSKDSAWLNG